MRFYVNGVLIKIEFSFILIIAFAIIIKADNLIYLLIFSAVHELAHLIALIVFREKPDRIIVSFYGIGLKHSAHLKIYQQFIFLIAGVSVNALFSLLNIHREVNLPLLIINSLPLYPLDGGRVLKLLLNEVLPLNISDIIFRIITGVTIILMALYAVKTHNFSFIIILIYILIFTFKFSFD